MISTEAKPLQAPPYGGACKGLASVEIIIPSQSTARIQEAHKVIIHIICELIEPALQTASNQQ